MKTEKTDPSMDEILASIRQIISSDSQKEEKSLTQPKDEENILDLTEALPEKGPNTEKTQDTSSGRNEKKEDPKHKHAHSRKEEVKHRSDEVSKSISKAPAMPRLNSLEDEKSEPEKEGSYNSRKEASKKLQDTITQEFLSTPTFDEPLVSQTAMSEAAQALHSLNKLAQEIPKDHEPRLNQGIGGKTVENLVREILRPLLKEWLDANLPTLVRWVVNEQVEKIVRQLGVKSPDSVSDKSKLPPKF